MEGLIMNITGMGVAAPVVAPIRTQATAVPHTPVARVGGDADGDNDGSGGTVDVRA
jgi:hypothetical protein